MASGSVIHLGRQVHGAYQGLVHEDALRTEDCL